VGLPVIFFIAGWGGLHPAVVFTAILAPVGPVLALATASQLASIWCRTTHAAILSVYLVTALAVAAAVGMAHAGISSDPRRMLEAVGLHTEPREAALHLLRSWLVCGSVTVICFVLSMACLRRAARHQRPESMRTSSRWWRRAARPPVSDNPVRWKEYHVGRS